MLGHPWCVKLQTVTPFVIHECLGPRFDRFEYLQVVGTAGGVIVAWVSQEVSVLGSRVDTFSVSVELATPLATSWSLSAVYGPTATPLKPLFLEELRLLRAAFVGPWAVAGNFNLILDAADKNTPVLDRWAMGQFRRCVNELELKEAPLLGRRYTWSNARSTPTMVRLDRWFASLDWEELFPDASLTARSSSLSDHCPILLSTASDTRMGLRFRFEQFWLRLDGFA
jgi:hypothetical protein